MNEFSAECDQIIHQVESYKPLVCRTIGCRTIECTIDKLEWLSTSLQIINKKLHAIIDESEKTGADIGHLEEVALTKINDFVIRHN